MSHPPKPAAVSRPLRRSLIALGVAQLALASFPSFAATQPTASQPYTLSVFAQSVTGQYTKPDDIAVVGSRIFIVFGNGVAKDGTDGKSSTIVEYRLDGSVVQTFSIKGHSDGLKVDPTTGLLWLMQNEDGNPNLVILNPDTGAQTVYTFEPTEQGGGYDDLVFRDGRVFMTASAPSANPNTAPAVVSATLSGSIVTTNGVLAGNATALDITTNTSVTLNLQDPDSMIVAPNGDVVFTSQDDAELVIVQHLGEDNQRVYRVPFTSSGMATKVDDTVFATASDGFLLVSDNSADVVYRVDKPYWASGAYSAGINASSVGIVGVLDFGTGNINPVVTGLNNPHGMKFVSPSTEGAALGVGGFIPTVASSPGLFGAFYRTSVQLFNQTGTEVGGRLVFHAQGTLDTNSDPSLSYRLGPGESRAIPDLLPAMGLSGKGSLDLVPDFGAAPVVVAKVFNDAGQGGTDGATEQALRSDEALGAGEQGVLIAPVDFSQIRFNIGVRTLSAGVSLALTVRDGSGNTVKTVSWAYPANYYTQSGASDLLNGYQFTGGESVVVTVYTGNAFVYGTTADDRTNTPSLQIARPLR